MCGQPSWGLPMSPCANRTAGALVWFSAVLRNAHAAAVAPLPAAAAPVLCGGNDHRSYQPRRPAGGNRLVWAERVAQRARGARLVRLGLLPRCGVRPLLGLAVRSLVCSCSFLPECACRCSCGSCGRFCCGSILHAVLVAVSRRLILVVCCNMPLPPLTSNAPMPPQVKTTAILWQNSGRAAGAADGLLGCFCGSLCGRAGGQRL